MDIFEFEFSRDHSLVFVAPKPLSLSASQHSENEYSEASKELQEIFLVEPYSLPDPNQAVGPTSNQFISGSSPPARAGNPLPLDSNFRLTSQKTTTLNKAKEKRGEKWHLLQLNGKQDSPGVLIHLQ